MNQTPSNACPKPVDLQGYAIGALPDDDASRVGEHLNICRECGDTLDSLRHSSDTILDALQHLDTKVDFLDEPELVHGIDRLRSRTHAADLAIGLESLGSPIIASQNVDQHADRSTVANGARGRSKQHEIKLDRPAQLGPYQIISKLGQGGMGSVYKAIHTHLGKTVAIKVLSSDRFGDRQSTERFKREMKAIGRVQHPNVVVAHDGGQIDNEHFLVMEYVDGVDVSTLDRTHRGLPVSVACEIIRQAAMGLQHAHEMGLIHRDIKPSNLMLDQAGGVKVLDLGLARIESDLSSLSVDRNEETQAGELTAAGTAMGTAGYMSPEQALDSSRVDQRADLYSLGATLYKLLAGTLPFPTEKYDTNGKMLVAIATQEPPSLATIRADLPIELVHLVDKMLSKEPGDRITTAAEFAERLRPFAGVELADLASAPTGELPAALVDALLESTFEEPAAAAQLKSVRSKVKIVAFPVLLFSALLFAAAQTFWIRTEHGTLLVEITDEQVEARLKSDGISVIDKRSNKIWEVNTSKNESHQLPQGEYRFEAPAGLVITDEQGLEIDAKEFKLLAADKQIRIRVSMTADRGATTFGETDSPVSSFDWFADAPSPAIAPFNAEQAEQHQEAWAKHLDVPVEYTNSIGMKFRLIPPGEFLMGSTPKEIEAALKLPGDDDTWRGRVEIESPQHKVILTQPLYVAVTEVTQTQYEQVMGINPSNFSATGEKKEAVANLENGNHPVERVSWNDAAEFCSKLSQQENLNPFYFRSGDMVTPFAGTGYRLPTEAEWEFACRAGTTTRFWSGDEDKDLVAAGWYGDNSGGRTHAVGKLKANPFGLSDVHGNVWEWVQDGWEPTLYGKYAENAAVDPYVPFHADPQRCLRGGYFFRGSSLCRSANRHARDSTNHGDNIGFRVVLAIDSVENLLNEKPTETNSTTPKNETSMAAEQPRNSIIEANERFEVASEVPQAYELTFSLKRESGNEGALLVDLPVMDRRVTVVLAGYGKTRSGLNLIDGKQTHVNESSVVGDPFTDGQVHRVVIRVTDVSVSASVDGATLFDWNGDVSRLSSFNESTLTGLHIKSGQETRFQISDWSLRDLSEHEWPSDQPGPALAPFNADQATEYQRKWAKHLGIDIETINSIGMKFRVIPPGEFLMGTAQDEMDELQARVSGQHADLRWFKQQMMRETPQHQVVLTKPFQIGIHEVTRGQFREFVEATGYQTDAEKDGKGGFSTAQNPNGVQSIDYLWSSNLGFEPAQTDDHPVVNVSWNDAAAFCAWLSQKEDATYRLPTEAEWEFSCRSGSEGRFTCGDDATQLLEYGWCGGSGSHPVGQKKPNAFGLFDLHGNVFEWCADKDTPYADELAIDPMGSQGSWRTKRGGSWRVDWMRARNAYRLSFEPTARHDNLGFRVVRIPGTPKNP